MELQVLFDLKSAVFADSDPVEAILAAESNKSLHMIKITNPTPLQKESLLNRGYELRSQWVDYVLRLEDLTQPSGYDSYLARLSPSRRRQARRAQEQVDKLVRSGRLTFVIDKSHSLGDLDDFVALHTAVMEQKERGRCILKQKLIDLGGLSALSSAMPLAMYFKDEGRLSGGLLAYNRPEGYSIGFCACSEHLTNLVNNAQLYMVMRLLQMCIDEKRSAILYGTDTNLYGHHLDLGLLIYKRSLLFTPIPNGTMELIKFLRFDVFKFPIAFYQFDNGQAFLRLISDRELEPDLQSRLDGPDLTLRKSLLTSATQSLPLAHTDQHQ